MISIEKDLKFEFHSKSQTPKTDLVEFTYIFLIKDFHNSVILECLVVNRKTYNIDYHNSSKLREEPQC